MGNVMTKYKTPSKPFIPQKDKCKKPFQRDWPRKVKLDDEIRSELERKKLCFTFKEPWEPQHRCLGKGKIPYIEVVSNGEDEEEEPTPNDEPSYRKDEQPHEKEKPYEEKKSPLKVKIACLSGTPKH